METKKYYRKWSITYKGKPYLSMYGKKNAYDMLYRLNKYFDSLDVQPHMEQTEEHRKRVRTAKRD